MRKFGIKVLLNCPHHLKIVAALHCEMQKVDFTNAHVHVNVYVFTEAALQMAKYIEHQNLPLKFIVPYSVNSNTVTYQS